MGAMGVMLLGVNDRDMLMRFRGGGVGNKSMRTEMHCLLDDRDELDERSFEKEKEGSQSRSELVKMGIENVMNEFEGILTCRR